MSPALLKLIPCSLFVMTFQIGGAPQINNLLFDMISCNFRFLYSIFRESEFSIFLNCEKQKCCGTTISDFKIILSSFYLIFIDSDSEEDEFKPEFRNKNLTKSKSNGTITKKGKTDEKQLKNEILELEKTFESLDFDRKTPTSRTGLFRTTSIAATAFLPQHLPYSNRPNRRQSRSLQVK